MKHGMVVAGLVFFILLAAVSKARAAEPINVWPLFYYDSTANQTDLEVLYPLFETERKPEKEMWRLLLAGHSRSKQETVWDFIWPIWRVQYDSAGGADSRFFPLFFGHNEQDRYIVLFPELWWFRGDKPDHSAVILPFLWGRTKAGTQYGALVPVALWSQGAKEAATVYVFPFFRHSDGPTKTSTGFLPWWTTRDGGRRFINLFPVVWQRTGDKTDFFHVLPLFFSTKKSRVLFPLFWDTEETLLIIPVYGRGESDGKWEAYLPPFYVHRATSGGSQEHYFLWPFAAHARGGGRTLDRFFPIFNYDRRPAGLQMSLLWPLYDWEKRDDGRGSLSIGTWFVFANNWRKEFSEIHALTFFWDINKKPMHSQGFWPLYTYKRREKGNVNASFLDPLWFWGEATGEEEHASALLKILDYRRQPNGDSRFSFLWRAYRRDKRGDTASWESFPFMAGQKSPERSWFSFMWRLFEYEKADGKRSMRLFFSPKIGLGKEK